MNIQWRIAHRTNSLPGMVIFTGGTKFTGSGPHIVLQINKVREQYSQKKHANSLTKQCLNAIFKIS